MMKIIFKLKENNDPFGNKNIIFLNEMIAVNCIVDAVQIYSEKILSENSSLNLVNQKLKNNISFKINFDYIKRISTIHFVESSVKSSTVKHGNSDSIEFQLYEGIWFFYFQNDLTICLHVKKTNHDIYSKLESIETDIKTVLSSISQLEIINNLLQKRLSLELKVNKENTTENIKQLLTDGAEELSSLQKELRHSSEAINTHSSTSSISPGWATKKTTNEIAQNKTVEATATTASAIEAQGLILEALKDTFKAYQGTHQKLELSTLSFSNLLTLTQPIKQILDDKNIGALNILVQYLEGQQQKNQYQKIEEHLENQQIIDALKEMKVLFEQTTQPNNENSQAVLDEKIINLIKETWQYLSNLNNEQQKQVRENLNKILEENQMELFIPSVDQGPTFDMKTQKISKRLPRNSGQLPKQITAVHYPSIIHKSTKEVIEKALVDIVE